MFLFEWSSVFTIFAGLLIFVLTPARQRWLVLLSLSLILLVQGGWLAFSVAAAQTLLAYAMGFWLEHDKRRGSLWVCVIVQLLPLLAMKSQLSLGALWFPVPIGLSYYTFQLLSYLIDISWERRHAEPHLGRFALYSLLFMNKATGPIERSSIIDGWRSIPTPSGEQICSGIFWIWLGICQKTVIADHIGRFVEPVLAQPQDYQGVACWIAMLLSKYQIFCDFSGGSQIAIGLGLLFGTSLTQNFARPFAAKSIRDFWRRWHISLQSWIRDYVFYPTLTTRVGQRGLFVSLLATYLVFALWHGFRWTLVIYGIIQAVLVWSEPENVLRKFKLTRVFVIPFNYVILICGPSILFRVPTLSIALNFWSSLGVSLKNVEKFLENGRMSLLLLIALILLHELFLFCNERYKLLDRLLALHWIPRSLIIAALFLIPLSLAELAKPPPFIYSLY